MIFNLLTALTGGGGLEYESGTWTPTSDTTRGTINFATTHSKPPAIVLINRVADDSSLTIKRTNMTDAFCAIDNATLNYGNPVGYRVSVRHPSTTGSSLSYVIAGNAIKYSADNTGNTSQDYFRYFADENAMYPVATGSSYPLHATVYNWVAIWAPTT